MMIVQFDVDGVLADFHKGFYKLGNAVYGAPLLTTADQKKWNEWVGLDSKQISYLWSLVKKSGTWWTELEPLATPEEFRRIEILSRNHDVYFVTSRPGLLAKQQTEVWLFRQGIANPTVIMSNRKGEVANTLGVQFAIEDKAENAWCIAWLSQAASFLLDWPQNRYDSAFGASQVKRVSTLGEFLDAVER